MLSSVEAIGPLLSFAFVAAPYWVARILARIRMPRGIRLAIVLAVPAAFFWWVATNGDLTDITSPGAALIVGVMLFGWVAGASRTFRRRVIARAGGEAGS
jgi:hypothetical protein